jgi:hypothetical protein
VSLPLNDTASATMNAIADKVRAKRVVLILNRVTTTQKVTPRRGAAI